MKAGESFTRAWRQVAAERGLLEAEEALSLAA